MDSKNLSDYKNKKLTGNLDTDTAIISNILKKDGMLRIRRVNFSCGRCTLFFMDGMANGSSVSEEIVRSLVTAKNTGSQMANTDYIADNLLYSGEIEKTDVLSEMLGGILYGDTLLVLDGDTSALVINTKGFKMRGVSEPPNERVTEGPREGFGESVLINVALIRRKLQTPDFCAEPICCGRRTATKTYICYLDSLADKSTVAEVKRRIEKLDIDGVLDTNYITESIRDHKNSIFKTVGSTERPDVAAARLLEGRIAVISDGTPSVITVPYLLSENFQSDDDYYMGYLLGSVGRIFRLLSFFIACFLPGIYVALVTFHAGLMPTASALAILRLRIGVPSSTLTESLLLIITFEILKEACSRAPRDTGTALSVVGGLVIGEAAVNTETISAPTLIVVAIAGICTIMVPRLRAPALFINIGSVLAAGLMGLFGLFSVSVCVVLYVLKLNSFGTDYTELLVKPDFQNIKDVLFRAPWTKMIKRPPFNKNRIRQKK